MNWLSNQHADAGNPGTVEDVEYVQDWARGAGAGRHRTAVLKEERAAVLYAVGVLIFAVGLLVSIALHEVGHLVPAKKFGVKVSQYMVGFGPTVWSRRKGDTEYGLKAHSARRLHPDDRHGAAARGWHPVQVAAAHGVGGRGVP